MEEEKLTECLAIDFGIKLATKRGLQWEIIMATTKARKEVATAKTITANMDNMEANSLMKMDTKNIKVRWVSAQFWPLFTLSWRSTSTLSTLIERLSLTKNSSRKPTPSSTVTLSPDPPLQLSTSSQT